MALIPDSYKTGGAFFHSISKTITEASQYPFESNYKSGHTVTLKDVFGDEIPYAGDAVTADLNVTNNPTIIKKYTQYSLTEVPGSNQQAWKIVFAGNDVKSLISAVDVLNPINATPSFGYEPKLYTQGSVFIPPTTGAWWIDFYSGIVHFANGFTPNLLGWGVLKLTVYAYIGRSLGNVISTLVATLYRGLWNPTTNVPTIATGSANDGNLGNYYICSKDGNTLVGTVTDGMTPGGSIAISQDLAHRGTKIGFFNTLPVLQQTGGVNTAGGTYTANEQSMLQTVYDALRTYGLLS